MQSFEFAGVTSVCAATLLGSFETRRSGGRCVCWGAGIFAAGTYKGDGCAMVRGNDDENNEDDDEEGNVAEDANADFIDDVI